MLRFLILAARLFPTTVSSAPFDEIRSMCGRAQLQVGNDFGNVSVEVWDQLRHGFATIDSSPSSNVRQ